MNHGIRTIPGIKSWGKARRVARVISDDDVPEFDGDFPLGFMEAGATVRRSDSVKGVAPAALAQLDAMIETHGATAILRSVRELLDSRAYADDSDTFADAEECDAWKAKADQIEELLLRMVA